MECASLVLADLKDAQSALIQNVLSACTAIALDLQVLVSMNLNIKLAQTPFAKQLKMVNVLLVKKEEFVT